MWRNAGNLIGLSIVAAARGTGGADVAVPVLDAGPDGSGLVADWTDSSKQLDIGNGWSLSACERDAPMLCVAKDGELAGVVEATAYPLDSFGVVDPSADPDTNLRAIAHEFTRDLQRDRAAGCGSDYQFTPREPAPTVLGGVPGISYGFKAAMADGSPSELNLHYTTIVDYSVISIVAAAYDAEGCLPPYEVVSFDSAGLLELRPLLEDVLAGTPLPLSTLAAG